MNLLLLSVASGFVVALLASRVYLTRALRSGLLDLPSARSSHHQPTPTGGGVGIIAGVLGAAVPVFATTGIGLDWALVLLLAIALGVLGHVDDRKPLGVAVRLLCHALAALTLLGVLALLNPALREGWMILFAVLVVPAALYLGWLTNLFNFMDGIDGLAAAQALFIAAAGAGLCAHAGGADDTVLLLAATAAACAGFLVFNWAPARLFMGDTGSLFLGFLLAGASLLSAVRGELALPVWLILWAVFVCDASITLAHRVLRGEQLQLGHRDHAYQRLARMSGSHARVALGVALLNLIWLLPLAMLAQANTGAAVLILLAAYVPVVAAVVLVIRSDERRGRE